MRSYLTTSIITLVLVPTLGSAMSIRAAHEQGLKAAQKSEQVRMNDALQVGKSASSSDNTQWQNDTIIGLRFRYPLSWNSNTIDKEGWMRVHSNNPASRYPSNVLVFRDRFNKPNAFPIPLGDYIDKYFTYTVVDKLTFAYNSTETRIDEFKSIEQGDTRLAGHLARYYIYTAEAPGLIPIKCYSVIGIADANLFGMHFRTAAADFDKELPIFKAMLPYVTIDTSPASLLAPDVAKALSDMSSSDAAKLKSSLSASSKRTVRTQKSSSSKRASASSRRSAAR